MPLPARDGLWVVGHDIDDRATKTYQELSAGVLMLVCPKSSAMGCTPQIFVHVMPLFAFRHGSAMIQCLSKFFGERSSVEGGVHLGVVVEINIHVALARCVFSAGK